VATASAMAASAEEVSGDERRQNVILIPQGGKDLLLFLNPPEKSRFLSRSAGSE
jgi:hypothetical protein